MQVQFGKDSTLERLNGHLLNLITPHKGTLKQQQTGVGLRRQTGAPVVYDLFLAGKEVKPVPFAVSHDTKDEPQRLRTALETLMRAGGLLA